MKPRLKIPVLFRRRSLWCPTIAGWTLILVCFFGPGLLWCYKGESFLAQTERLPAEVLVVEGWIGQVGIRAAYDEFKQGGYRYLVATGGMTGERWDAQRWSFAEVAKAILVSSGADESKLFVAQPNDTEEHRTYESAAAVQRALNERNIHPAAINVFTLGAHARRSRLVFAKATSPDIKVGVISWSPAAYRTGPWWRSSDRAETLLVQSAGYLYELLLNSGRRFGTDADHKITR